ncbi:hypothetical protein SAMN05444170_2972 [Bradyrhizobium erythrophlei]|jgi:hypothetical protein|uniref:Uncharacterized protein n=1 Tax=Bradyrhizobium erythrophlei TaxID=1437360 RepID=A0A1M7TXL4_9BRAD|nr:hypothetical protein SAMN05444170_2972 [Bradyrhizobium erythrophlei]
MTFVVTHEAVSGVTAVLSRRVRDVSLRLCVVILGLSR